MGLNEHFNKGTTLQIGNFSREAIGKPWGTKKITKYKVKSLGFHLIKNYGEMSKSSSPPYASHMGMPGFKHEENITQTHYTCIKPLEYHIKLLDLPSNQVLDFFHD